MNLDSTSAAIHPDKTKMATVGTNMRNIGYVREFRKVSDYVYRFDCLNANVAVSFVSDDIVRIKLFFVAEFSLDTTVGVLPQRTSPQELTVHETDAAITLRTSTMQVVITKDNFTLQAEDLDGNPFYTQNNVIWDNKGGVTTFNHMDSAAHFYGLGEKTSFLDKRGERYEMWNTDVFAPHVPEIEALYESIPFLIHFKNGSAYGLFLDNPGKTTFDMRTMTDYYTVQNSTGEMDYYIIKGPVLKDVVKRYTDLTGRMTVPPKWSIGYHQSRYSYMSQEEVLELARSFRDKNIPCDVIYLDIHYMDEYRVFTFDKTRFPNPMEMMKELRAMGMRIVPIVDPGVKQDPRYEIYKEGVLNDFFCKKIEGDLFIGPVWPGDSAFPDFTEDEVGRWWADKHRFYTDMGIQGVWNDMNEPAVFNESKTMDLDVIHRNNGNMKTHEELHNLYGMLMSKATYEGLREQLNGERPFVLTRAGYSGIQRYAAVWTGDNRSFWEHMAMAMPMCLNLGLSGIPFTGPDIGGFAHHTTGDLLVRWTQMGVFFPYCRNHSVLDSVRQEPWSFGPEVENIVREYVNLRYRLMPHLYNLFFEASVTGMPVMRPFVLEYPNDPNVLNLCDQFLFGSDMIIAPIIRPDTAHRSVYLPEGVWHDYWTGRLYEGGQHILAHAPLHVMPMYVKAGSLMPEQSQTHYAEEATDGVLRLNVYGVGGDGSYGYELYEDDGATFAYEQGKYNVVSIGVEESAAGAVLSYEYAHKGYESEHSGWLVNFKFAAFEPSDVAGLNRVGAEGIVHAESGWAYDADKRELLVKFAPSSAGGTITIS
ncbi:alpha-glucosidase [Paenibacillus swuensis]|uniref:Alpha-glucosidase n=1 Tax=Paenibacillus swuensis TaxID=1178515 RepID=A0A172TER2_9BACL|nr:glycoside hydrolase family 31 protein [Paenibacillus swuensis]ANE45555.1 alpha-glucosidase [Paenibacillus swuensis]